MKWSNQSMRAIANIIYGHNFTVSSFIQNINYTRRAGYVLPLLKIKIFIIYSVYPADLDSRKLWCQNTIITVNDNYYYYFVFLMAAENFHDEVDKPYEVGVQHEVC